MHNFQLLRKVHNNIVGIKESREGAINNLGSVWRVGTNVGQQQAGPE